MNDLIRDDFERRMRAEGHRDHRLTRLESGVYLSPVVQRAWEEEKLKFAALSDKLCARLSDLLSRTAIALRGPEPPLTRWSFHDVPERAAAAIAALSLVQGAERERCAQIARNGCLVPPDGGSPTDDERLLCEEIERRIRYTGHDSDCAMHNAPAYPAGECDCGALGPNVTISGRR